MEGVFRTINTSFFLSPDFWLSTLAWWKRFLGHDHRVQDDGATNSREDGAGEEKLTKSQKVCFLSPESCDKIGRAHV